MIGDLVSNFANNVNISSAHVWDDARDDAFPDDPEAIMRHRSFLPICLHCNLTLG